MAACLVLAASGVAFGQAFSFTANDLMLGFRQTGAPNTLLLDLGNVGTFVDNAYAGGATVTIGNGSLVASVFTSLSSVRWSAAAAYDTSGPGDAPLSTLFISEARNTSPYTTQPAGYTSQSAAQQGQTANSIQTLGLDANSYTTSALGAGPLPTGSSATVAIIPSGSGFDYSSIINPGGNASKAYNNFQSSLATVENRTSSGTSGIIGRVDLFEQLPGSVNHGTDLGFFTLSNNSGVTSLTYTPLAAVPEPSEYAAVSALALAGFALWRRRASK